MTQAQLFVDTLKAKAEAAGLTYNTCEVEDTEKNDGVVIRYPMDEPFSDQRCGAFLPLPDEIWAQESIDDRCADFVQTLIRLKGYRARDMAKLAAEKAGA